MTKKCQQAKIDALEELLSCFYAGIDTNGNDIDIRRNEDAAIVVNTYIESLKGECSMAIKNSTKLQPTALDVVRNLSCDVYLGGSRRMAEKYSSVDISKDTDYDFYCTYSNEVAEQLQAGGFVPSTANEDYGLDDEAVLIMARDDVQVVLRKNAEFYEKVFENIPEHVYYSLLWKSSPVAKRGEMKLDLILPMFNMLFAVAHAFEGKK